MPESNQERCLFLDMLPAEIRLVIYELVYAEPCEPLLILRDNTSIQRTLDRRFAHTGPALLRTCKTIHSEAAPIMYDKANFRIQIYIGSGWPSYQPCGPVDATNPMLRQIRRLSISLYLVDVEHIDPAIQRLGILAKALEEGNGMLKVLNVEFKAVTSYQMAVTRDLVTKHLLRTLQALEGDVEAAAKRPLYRKMLRDGSIKSAEGVSSLAVGALT